MDKHPPAWQVGERIKTWDRPGLPAVAPYQPAPLIEAEKVAPTKYKNAKGVMLPLALHHIIPWSALREFWGELFKREHFEAFKEFASLYGCPKPQLKRLRESVRQQKFQAVLLEFDGLSLDQLICWGKWNLVRGPAFRVGSKEAQGHVGFDPSDDFDDFHWFAKDANRLVQLRSLFGGIKKYVDNPKSDSTGDERDLIAFLQSFRNSSVLAEIVEFDQKMWLVDPNSPDYVPGNSAYTAVHPKWWKRQR